MVIHTKFNNFFFCTLGCVSCFCLQKYLTFPSVLSSVLVGLVASFLPKSKFWEQTKSITCLYTGSFAAMCSLSFFTSPLHIIVLSLIVGVYFNMLDPHFKGFGGKLGSIAFFSSCSFIFLLRLL